MVGGWDELPARTSGPAAAVLIAAKRTVPRERNLWGHMPTTPHIERHFSASAVVRDIVIGMADGLTVPFALAAGLTGAVDASRLIVVAGLAEIAAGSIAMGLGGYLAARSDEDHYASEHSREEREIVDRLDDERAEVHEILEG